MRPQLFFKHAGKRTIVEVVMSSVRRPHGALVVLSVRVLLAAGLSPGRADQSFAWLYQTARPETQQFSTAFLTQIFLGL